MTSQATLTYTVNLAGLVSQTAMQSLLQSVPLPITLLNAIGVSLVSDTVGGAPNTATRTVVLSLVPSTAPTARATIGGNASGNSVTALSLIAQGQGLTAPPIVQFSGGNPTQPAQAVATLNLQSIGNLVGGANYSAQTTVAFVGGLGPGGVSPTGHVTIGSGGTITSIVIDTPGSKLVAPPKIVITDPTSSGSGASATSIMQVDQLQLLYGGQGYSSTPNVTLVPLFKYIWPDTLGSAKQAQPFFNLLTGALIQACGSPVIAAAPVIA
jgi:hypothetical protein